jgi:hypothetical protein
LLAAWLAAASQDSQKQALLHAPVRERFGSHQLPSAAPPWPQSTCSAQQRCLRRKLFVKQGIVIGIVPESSAERCGARQARLLLSGAALADGRAAAGAAAGSAAAASPNRLLPSSLLQPVSPVRQSKICLLRLPHPDALMPALRLRLAAHSLHRLLRQLPAPAAGARCGCIWPVAGPPGAGGACRAGQQGGLQGASWHARCPGKSLHNVSHPRWRPPWRPPPLPPPPSPPRRSPPCSQQAQRRSAASLGMKPAAGTPSQRRPVYGQRRRRAAAGPHGAQAAQAAPHLPLSALCCLSSSDTQGGYW